MQRQNDIGYGSMLPFRVVFRTFHNYNLLVRSQYRSAFNEMDLNKLQADSNTFYSTFLLTPELDTTIGSQKHLEPAGLNCLFSSAISACSSKEDMYHILCENRMNANFPSNILILQNEFNRSTNIYSLTGNIELSSTKTPRAKPKSSTTSSSPMRPNFSTTSSKEILSNSCTITPHTTQSQPSSISHFNMQPNSQRSVLHAQTESADPCISPNIHSHPFKCFQQTTSQESFCSPSISKENRPKSSKNKLHQLYPKSCSINANQRTHCLGLFQVLTVTLMMLLTLDAMALAVDTKHKLHISVLVPDDDVRPFTRKQMQPAIELAVEKVTDPGGLLQEVDVHVHYADSKCDIAHGIKGAIELHYRGEADVFVGPVCDYTAAPVARQSVFWDTPVLTYAQAKDFRAEKMLSKVTRVGNDFFQLGEFLNTVFQRNNWYKFTIIYDPKAWDNLIDRLGHIMAESIHATMYNLTGHISTYYKMNLKEVQFDRLLLDNVGTEFAGKPSSFIFTQTNPTPITSIATILAPLLLVLVVIDCILQN